MITPRTPSEPASIRSGLTPAPEPGSRRDSHTPAGVIARVDSTKSSMWVQDGREVPGRARGDPAAERGVLERLREVTQRETVLGELGLQAGSRGARLDQGRARDRIDLEHTVQRAQVDRDGAVVVRRPTSGVTPPTTDVPPP